MMMGLVNNIDTNMHVSLFLGQLLDRKTSSSSIRIITHKLAKSNFHSQTNQHIRHSGKQTPNQPTNRQSLKINWQILKSKSCANIKNHLHLKSNAQTLRSKNIQKSPSVLQINKATKYQKTKRSPIQLTQTISTIHKANSLRKYIQHIGEQKFTLPNKKTQLQPFIGKLQQLGLLSRLKNNDLISSVEKKQKKKGFLKKGSTLEKNMITNLIKSKLVHQNLYQRKKQISYDHITSINKVDNDSHSIKINSLVNFAKTTIQTQDYSKEFTNSQSKIQQRLKTSNDIKPTILDKQMMQLDGWQIQREFENEIFEMARNSI